MKRRTLAGRALEQNERNKQKLLAIMNVKVAAGSSLERKKERKGTTERRKKGRTNKKEKEKKEEQERETNFKRKKTE